MVALFSQLQSTEWFEPSNGLPFLSDDGCAPSRTRGSRWPVTAALGRGLVGADLPHLLRLRYPVTQAQTV